MSPNSVEFLCQAPFINDWPESEAAVYRQLATKRNGGLLDAIPMFFIERMASIDSSPKTPPQMLSIKHTLTAQEKFALLNCRRLPARLNSSETALLLGLHDHDIAPLVAAKLLHPLGKPAQNAPKYFAAVDVIVKAEDREWLSNATKALARHWQAKNSRPSAVGKLHVEARRNKLGRENSQPQRAIASVDAAKHWFSESKETARQERSRSG